MKQLFLLLAVALCGNVFAQTTQTVTFKPGAEIGKDALIETSYDCIKKGNPMTSASMNFGNSYTVRSQDWTNFTNGCSRETARSLLKFDELSTIPQGAVIISAELKLYGEPTDTPYGGNSFFPGTDWNTPNPSHILRVTSDWDEQTVTWNTQPTTTTVNQIAIPQTTSQFNWNFTDSSDSLVAMIQDMVSNPETNFGFMLKLDTEAYYRKVAFVSSDNPESALHPELTVTYEYTEPCSACEASFAYMVTAGEPDNYSFMAANQAESHEWTINGNNVSNLSSCSQILPEGSNSITYTRYLNGKKCVKTITICVAEGEKEPEQDPKEDTEDPGEITGDDNLISKDSTSAQLLSFPNPAATEWNVEFQSSISEKVVVTLFNMNGTIVYEQGFSVQTGKNSVTIDAKRLASGSYIVEIKGATISFSDTLIRN